MLNIENRQLAWRGWTGLKYKLGLMGLITVTTVSLQALEPEVANASTQVEYAATNVQVSGKESISVQHIVANDPWTGKTTSWYPIYYLQKDLQLDGVQTTWNGNTLDVTSIPSGWHVNVSGAPQPGTPPEGQMQFAIGSDQDGFLRAPKLVANDPETGKPTTYVPIYYLDLFLQQRLLMGVSWGGATWVIAAPQDVNRIELIAAPTTVNVGETVTFSGKLVLVGGVGAPHAELSVLGLPNQNQKTIFTNSEGLFSFTTTFAKSGVYTIAVGDGLASWQVHVTVK